jgi:hypothetical protein
MEVELVIHARQPTPKSSIGGTKVQMWQTPRDAPRSAFDNQQDNWTEQKFTAATPQRHSPPSAAQRYFVCGVA